MYSPAIITTEKAFQPFPSGSDRFILVLPPHSFCEGNPSLVDTSPCLGLGPMDLNTYEQDSSLLLDTTLSGQTSPPPAAFWGQPNSLERSGRWI